MLTVFDALRSSDLPSGTVVTIGNYDGIHRGQQEVLRRVVERARHRGLLSAVVTFEPHPLSVLAPESAPERLTTPAQKERLLDELGLDLMVVVTFDEELAKTPAREFVHGFLHQRLGAAEVHVGTRFTFGHRREGDVSLLRELGGSCCGFETFAIDEVAAGGEAISSTRIRRLLGEGDVAAAADLLGRPYAVVGQVASGDRMGQRLGWPTINLQPENELVPIDGVYATRVHFPSFPATFDSATNIGSRPTVYENYERVVESHVLDFRADVYGERVELSFYKRLREERIFPSMMDLSAQIGRDVDATRDFFRHFETEVLRVSKRLEPASQDDIEDGYRE